MWNAEALKEQLDRQGRTRKWLAQQCGITLGSLQQVFMGRKPSRPVLKLMAIHLKCNEVEIDPVEHHLPLQSSAGQQSG